MNIMSALDSAKSATSNENYRLPSEATMKHAFKLSIVEDKPICLDYWTSSLGKTAMVGVMKNGNRLLVKSSSGSEYTSNIAKFYKIACDYVVVTTDSIYIVSADIPMRKIS